MKFWIVWEISCDFGRVMDKDRVFDSRDKAEDFVKKNYKNEDDYEIEEREVK